MIAVQLLAAAFAGAAVTWWVMDAHARRYRRRQAAAAQWTARMQPGFYMLAEPRAAGAMRRRDLFDRDTP